MSDFRNNFSLIVVLFILLIIVGCACMGRFFY
ncbi:YjcZ family sporulation protein [Bacillus alveayuensis]|nr:YjcZ family sporulation protein [Bacillus alveayuensis]